MNDKIRNPTPIQMISAPSGSADLFDEVVAEQRQILDNLILPRSLQDSPGLASAHMAAVAGQPRGGFREARLLLQLAELDIPAPPNCRHGLMIDKGLLSLVLMVQVASGKIRSLPVGLEEQDLSIPAEKLWDTILPQAKAIIADNFNVVTGIVKSCAACGQQVVDCPPDCESVTEDLPEGGHSIEEFGMGDGPDVPLCHGCGAYREPSCEVLWQLIAERKKLER